MSGQAAMVEVQMRIRKPVEQVFQAFIDPEFTTRFWFTHASGKLQAGQSVEWKWAMYGVSTTVWVDRIVPNQLIATRWGSPATAVDYIFTALEDNTTYVEIKNYGFVETGDDLIQAIKDNTGGFTTVLDGLKAYLEHGIELNLIADKFPNKLK